MSEARRHSIRFALTFAAVACLMGVNHYADAAPVLPDPSGVIFGPNGGSLVVPYSATIVFQDPFPPFLPELTETELAVGLPDPTVATSAYGQLKALLGFNLFAGVGVLMQYSFEIVGGPPSPVPVPVDIWTTWSISTSGWDAGYAAVDFYLQPGSGNAFTPNTIFEQGYQCATGLFAVPGATSTDPVNSAQNISPVAQCGPGTSLANDLLTSNTLYSLTLYANVGIETSGQPEGADGTHSSFGNTSAFIDPSIYIDPNFADAALYSVILRSYP